jgi:hypothetical protein
MLEELKGKFIGKLVEQYGAWEKKVSRFGNASFGKIATDLCISASQFSKLISGNATEGMYIRSIRNIDRLIEKQQANLEREEARAATVSLQESLRKQHSTRRFLPYLFFALCLGALAAYLLLPRLPASFLDESAPGRHPLSAYFDQRFDADYDSPYLKGSEVREYCPCAAYEGEWSLSEEYKLPLPGNRKPGVYYLAKSADVRMKCSKSDTLNLGQGRVLVAYEYLVNEVWVDTERTPLTPRFFNKENKQFTAEFDELEFENNPAFKKVATINSFFIDKFEIYRDSIVRRGEPCGRFAQDIDQDLADEYEIDLKHILENVISDLTQTDCLAAANKFCDPNDLREGESVIDFACLYTIKSENLGIGGGYPYRKGYRLVKQNYSDNLNCNCE